MGSGALHKLNARSLTRAVSSSNPHCPGVNREPPRLSSSCHSSSLQEAVEASFAKIKTKGRRAERLSPVPPLIPTAHLLHSSQRESTPAHALLMSLWLTSVAPLSVTEPASCGFVRPIPATPIGSSQTLSTVPPQGTHGSPCFGVPFFLMP